MDAIHIADITVPARIANAGTEGVAFAMIGTCQGSGAEATVRVGVVIRCALFAIQTRKTKAAAACPEGVHDSVSVAGGLIGELASRPHPARIARTGS